MFKLAIISLLIAAVSAGYLDYSYGAAPIYGATYGYAAHAPLAYAHSPVAVAHAPISTSYANTYRTVNKPIVTAVAAAPVATVAHAPVATVAHAPLTYSAPLAYGYGAHLGYSTLLHRR